jgi:hypothetical protein
MAADPSSLAAISPEYAMTLAKMGMGNRSRAPQNVGEGLTYIGERINEAAWRNVLLKNMQEKEGREKASWDAYLGLNNQTPGGMAAGPSPAQSAAPAPQPYTPQPAYQSPAQNRPAIMGGSTPAGMAGPPEATPAAPTQSMGAMTRTPSVAGGMAADPQSATPVPQWATAPRQQPQQAAAPVQQTAQPQQTDKSVYEARISALKQRMRTIDPNTAAGKLAVQQLMQLQNAVDTYDLPSERMQREKAQLELDQSRATTDLARARASALTGKGQAANYRLGIDKQNRPVRIYDETGEGGDARMEVLGAGYTQPGTITAGAAGFDQNRSGQDAIADLPIEAQRRLQDKMDTQKVWSSVYGDAPKGQMC